MEFYFLLNLWESFYKTYVIMIPTVKKHLVIFCLIFIVCILHTNKSIHIILWYIHCTSLVKPWYKNISSCFWIQWVFLGGRQKFVYPVYVCISSHYTCLLTYTLLETINFSLKKIRRSKFFSAIIHVWMQHTFCVISLCKYFDIYYIFICIFHWENQHLDMWRTQYILFKFCLREWTLSLHRGFKTCSNIMSGHCFFGLKKNFWFKLTSLEQQRNIEAYDYNSNNFCNK